MIAALPVALAIVSSCGGVAAEQNVLYLDDVRESAKSRVWDAINTLPQSIHEPGISHDLIYRRLIANAAGNDEVFSEKPVLINTSLKNNDAGRESPGNETLILYKGVINLEGVSDANGEDRVG